MGFFAVDDLDSPYATGQASIKLSDEDVSGNHMLAVICADRTASGSFSMGADYGANSKTWVGGAVAVLKN